MTVRSRLIAAGSPPGSITTIYTVPTGARTIIKEITAFHYANTSTLWFFIYRAGVAIGYLDVIALPNTELIRVKTWTVMMEDDQLRAYSDAGTLSSVLYYISGAELAV